MKQAVVLLALVCSVALASLGHADSEAPGMPKRVTEIEAQLEALAGLPASIAELQGEVSSLASRLGTVEVAAGDLAADLATALDRIDLLEAEVLELSGAPHPLTIHVGTVPANSIRTFVVNSNDLPGTVGETRTVVAAWRTNNGAHGWTLARSLDSAGTQHQTLSGFGPCGGPSGLVTKTFTYTKGVPAGGVHEFVIFNNQPIGGCQGGTISGLTFTFR